MMKLHGMVFLVGVKTFDCGLIAIFNVKIAIFNVKIAENGEKLHQRALPIDFHVAGNYQSYVMMFHNLCSTACLHLYQLFNTIVSCGSKDSQGFLH